MQVCALSEFGPVAAPDPLGGGGGLAILLFDLLGHRFEGSLDVDGVLGAGLEERNIVVFSKFCALLEADHPLVVEIAFISHQKFVDVLLGKSGG